MLVSSTTQTPQDRRLRISWPKRTAPLKSSTLFNKAKHSQEWHQCVENTAGVLKPSDPKFPYAFLRNHTDVYLQKKGKSSQADNDTRLASLVESHATKDLAIAAVAHAMSARSLRGLLSVEMNVAPRNYSGLGTWLQCLIAANNGNPASVTDLEALWARLLVPYAEHEQDISPMGLLLKGIGRALRKTPLSTLKPLPEYSILIQRAISDFATQLHGFTLRFDWNMAYKDVFWMSELDTSHATDLHAQSICLESILDSHLPTWKSWAHWKPDLNRLSGLISTESAVSAILTDILTLEGPDTVTGLARTMREGLIARYEGNNAWVRYRNLIIEVPERTRSSLAIMLARLSNSAEAIVKTVAGCKNGKPLLQFWSDITIAQPITARSLKVFEVLLDLPGVLETETYDIIRVLLLSKDEIGGQYVSSIQNLLHLLDDPRARRLSELTDRSRLLKGIETCLLQCQQALKQHSTPGNTFIRFVLEIHAFCMAVADSSFIFTIDAGDLCHKVKSVPSKVQMTWLAEVYGAIQAYSRMNGRASNMKNGDLILQTDVTSTRQLEVIQHPLERVIEEFCRSRLQELQPASIENTHTVNTLCQLWQNTSQPSIDVDRRMLAIVVSKITVSDDDLQVRCLLELAYTNTKPEQAVFIKSLLDIVLFSETNLALGIIEMARLLTKESDQAHCWKDLLYLWIKNVGIGEGVDALEVFLMKMNASGWLTFIHSLDTLFDDKSLLVSNGTPLPALLQPELLAWTGQILQYSHTISRLESVLGNAEVAKMIVRCNEGLCKKFAVSILFSLEQAEGKPVELLMQKITAKLAPKGDNFWEVKDCLVSLLQASSEAVEFCYRVWDAKDGHMSIPGQPKEKAERRTVTQAVAEVMIAGWIQDETIGSEDRAAVKVSVHASL